MHFGNVTTNRAESAHAKLKRHLGSSQGDLESSWTIINSLIELQHVEIKGSFEKSLMLVQHNFKPAIFRELRGVISRSALNMVLMQSQLAYKIGIDKVSCGCVIRSTYGLPCAHEIAEFMVQGRPIPLSTVHPHWTRLQLVQSAYDGVSSQVTIEPEIESIYKMFYSEPEPGKQVLKKKLREIVNPDTTSLQPPTMKVRTKGRPTSKKKIQIDTSTKRDPSLFEIVQSSQDSRSLATWISKRNTNRLKGYDDCFPPQIQPFLHNIVNVESDGHCGFRAIAGLLVASKYNVVLVHLSRIQCLTYLPLRSIPPPAVQHRMITIGFVNDCHFVQVFLKPRSPIPPVALNWYRFRCDNARDWETPYISRIQAFLSLVGQDVATQEVFDLSDT
ncbi:uncharacterized protein LOC127791693 [Diospyros lotus]|uniref:uncharacterized protein LOC127791693 n=1 Tax=Diospyros lotus TaxID=55363 RepID=UPI0022511947|nr:uncharacterized protein LOC127791693 [Diospyros lotus]